MEKSVFVLLIGDSEGKPVDLYQKLQEEDASLTARAGGFKVEVRWATNLDQYGALRQRLSTGALDAAIVEPASISTASLILGQLKGRTGLVLLNAWDPSFEPFLSAWGGHHPVATISQPQPQIGEIQGRQLSASLPQKAQVLVVTGPMRSSAARERLSGLRAALRDDIAVQTAEAGQWTEADGILAFNSWYGARASSEPIQAIVGHSDDLAVGAHKAASAVANPAHAASFRSARLFGVGAVPGYGREMVDKGTLAASVAVRPNAGQAVAMLKQFWADGRPLPARTASEALPYPASSVPSKGAKS